MKDLKDKAIKFKGQDYVLVKDRILALAEQGDYSIETDYQYFSEQKRWVVKAKLTVGGNTYTGLSQAVEGEGYINKTSALENAETSAVGRACAMAGIGVIDSIASMDEITKAQNTEKIMSKEFNTSKPGEALDSKEVPWDSNEPPTNNDKCKYCGAEMVKNPKTGKVFCSAKCFLKK